MTRQLVALLTAGLAIGACELAAKIDRSKIPTEQTVASAGGSGATGGTGTAGAAQGGNGGAAGALPVQCSDMMMNGEETDIDCGGTTCDPCANGMSCMTATDCVSLFCSSLTCAMCTDHADCAGAAGTYCDMATGNCVTQKTQGDACTEVEECASMLFCVDGFCCDEACDQVCESCGLMGTEGTCTCYMAGTDPEDQCMGGTPNCATCGMCGN